MVDHHHRAGHAGRDERRRRDARRSDGEVSGGVGKAEPRRSALGTVAAPDQKAAEAEAVREFHLNEERKRLLRVGEAERDFTSHFDL
jgi:hypothetical protein